MVFLLLAFWDKGGENTHVPFFLQRGISKSKLSKDELKGNRLRSFLKKESL
jgi:hypothetical protein